MGTGAEPQDGERRSNSSTDAMHFGQYGQSPGEDFGGFDDVGGGADMSMPRQCPNCGAQVTEEMVAAGSCAHCETYLDWNVPS
jgi:hypothetical protein